MPSPSPSGRRLRRHERRARSARRARHLRRFAGLLSVAVVLVVTLALTAFGSGSPAAETAQIAPAQRLLPARPPQPQVVALAGSLRLQLPVSQREVTAIGYHGAGAGALGLSPLGHRGNEGLLGRVSRRLFGGGGHGLRYFQLSGGGGPGTGALDVGAAPGSEVYAPVDGTITGISDVVLSGRRYGSRVDIQPSSAPSTVVSLTSLRVVRALAVGSAVAAGSSRLGTLVDVSAVERQALARYTQDAGNHVEIVVRPAVALRIP